jgi:hypothetical protein
VNKAAPVAMMPMRREAGAKRTEALEVFSDVDAIVNALLGTVRNAAGTERWLFRGQANHAWPLLPSALRSDVALLSPEGKWTKGLAATAWEQVRREMSTIHSFCRVADAAGQALPEDSQELRERFNSWILSDKTINDLEAGQLQWPPDELLSICGLAQHNGLPTRLLDWSYDPLVAAYFAAIGAASDGHGGASHLAVWALAESAIHGSKVLDVNRGARSTDSRPQIVKVTAPTAGNSNLRAQRGLFLLVRSPAFHPHKEPDTYSVGDAITGLPLLAAGESALKEFRLPIGDARLLLRALASHFVSSATITPDVRGAVNALFEQRLWPARVTKRVADE